MRESGKRFVALLLVLCMVLPMSITAFAEDDTPLLTLTGPEYIEPGETFVVDVNAQAADAVADGKLTVGFNSTQLRFAGVETGDAWGTTSLSVKANSAKEGTVIVAFAGSESADAGDVFRLKFEAVASGKSTIRVDGDKSYVTGTEKPLGATATVTVDCPAARFTDVDLSRYYHESLDYVVRKGYMIGITNTRFEPGTETSRAMLVTVLYRMAGSPQDFAEELPFTDIQREKFYFDALRWAYKNGITTGVTDTRFAPDQSATREEAVAFLGRFARYLGISTESSKNLSGYPDHGAISGYAEADMAWAVENGILLGTKDGKLNPGGTATRSETASFAARFDAAYRN